MCADWRLRWWFSFIYFFRGKSWIDNPTLFLLFACFQGRRYSKENKNQLRTRTWWERRKVPWIDFMFFCGKTVMWSCCFGRVHWFFFGSWLGGKRNERLSNMWKIIVEGKRFQDTKGKSWGTCSRWFGEWFTVLGHDSRVIMTIKFFIFGLLEPSGIELESTCTHTPMKILWKEEELTKNDESTTFFWRS